MRETPYNVRYALNQLHERITAEFREVPTEDPARWIDMRDLEWALRRVLNDVMDWQTRWRAAHRHPVTRWDLESDINRDLLLTADPGAPECNTCGELFATDADYWKHYVVTNVQYPNIGACWTRVAPEYAGSRPEWNPSRLAKRLEDLD